ncbi:MAG TPA: DEAD/DEAH box helicase [Symbiobacteriaceae bacterium]|nr:DEAD/DEAH box helicase [Symbiobacteriaceae bacterium]
MYPVQGTFVPTGATGFFFLWAIDPGAALPATGRVPKPHPAARTAEELLSLVKGIAQVNTTALVLTLPAENGLRQVKVPGLLLTPASAVTWLIDLPERFTQTGHQPAQSLRAFAAAAKLLLERLGRGQFYPALWREAGVLTSGWALAAPEPAEAERLHKLSEALPDLCRAIVPPDRDPARYQPLPGALLLDRFFRSAASGLAATFLPSAPPVHGPQSAAQHWLHALRGEGDLPPGLRDAEVLEAAVAAWSTPVSTTQSQTALRSGLRLHPPEETSQGWTVELILQTQDVPPETIPATTAWANLGRELVVGAHRFVSAEQRLLQDLPALVRLCPQLAPLLGQGAPATLALDEGEVVQFLQEGATALQEAGFAVQLPAGLVRGGRLATQMHLRGSGSSGFGLNQLVQVDWSLALGDQSLSLEELAHLAKQKRALVQIGNRWVEIDPAAITAALRRLEPYKEQIPLGEALRLSPELESLSADGWVADLLDRLRQPATIESVPTPRGLQGELRPYQQRGLDWLAFLRRFGLGACLADDMGLGKTIQLIALLLHERESGLTDRPSLLVAPVSLIGNWRREVARFAPHLRLLVHHGQNRLDAERFAAQAEQYDLILTTYSLLARDEEVLAAVPWAGIVADEAQNIKNPATQQAAAIRRLQADYRVALTGTPVENHLGDLWSLFSFLNPGLLGSQEEFRRRYAAPIERYRDQEATTQLRQQIGPLILRRLKSDPTIVADLPEKLENRVVTNLTLEQAALYEAVVQETLERVAAAEGIQRHGAILAGLTRLKQICNHPATVTQESAGALAGRSGKLDRLVEMLEEVVAEGDRALLFTQFPRFGVRIAAHLAQRLRCEVLALDGSTPAPERERRIARFQAGEAPLFLLSLKAGGVGLNLTAANHVFHIDRWWNPAVEEQATDRAHRIGQERTVMVHKLVTAGTLEERIDALLAEKRQLAAEVIGAGEDWLGHLSTEQLRELIRLEQE